MPTLVSGSRLRHSPTDPSALADQWWRGWNDAVDGWRQWWDTSAQGWEPMMSAWTRGGTPRGSRSGCGCGCGGAGGDKVCCDPCSCCVPDCDVLVTTRPGERRVVSFEVHNDRNRVRAVTASLSPWSSCDGAAIQLGAELTPAQLSLEPCGRATVDLVIEVPDAEGSTDAAVGQVRAGCSSLCADVSLGGCSRPVRVAVLVLPAGCESYRVDCGCECC